MGGGPQFGLKIGGGGSDPFPRSASVTFGACCSSLLSGVDPGGGGGGGGIGGLAPPVKNRNT